MVDTPDGGAVLHVQADWPEGADLEPFAYMLLYLQQGKLLKYVTNALNDKVDTSAVTSNARVIQHVWQTGFKKNDPDKPIVCPTKATSLLIKPFMH